MAIKPIEPGCLCVVVGGNPSLIGEQCTAIKWVNTGDSFITSHGPIKNASAYNGWAVEFCDGCGVFTPETLRRIDGGDPDAVQVERQDQEVTAHAHA